MNEPDCPCPYLDRRDVRCARLLTLSDLSETFRRCAGDYESCTVYHRIRTDEIGRPVTELVAEPV